MRITKAEFRRFPPFKDGEDILGVTQRYDPETEGMLSEFRALKKAFNSGKADQESKLRQLATDIASRSEGLAAMMGREIWQLDEQMKMATAG